MAAAVPALLSFFAILALILDAETAVSAASAGLQLCLQTVVPSLSPIFWWRRASLPALARWNGAPGWWGPVMGPAFGLPPQGRRLWYWACWADTRWEPKLRLPSTENRSLTKAEAERLLAFCSNAGPAFIFGMVGGLFGGGENCRRSVWHSHRLRLADRPDLSPQRKPSACFIRKHHPEAGVQTGLFRCHDRGSQNHGADLRMHPVVPGHCRLSGRALGTRMPPAVELDCRDFWAGRWLQPSAAIGGRRASVLYGLRLSGLWGAMRMASDQICDCTLWSHRPLLSLWQGFAGTIAVLLTWGNPGRVSQLAPRTLPTAPSPITPDFLRATAIVTALFLCGLGIWCLRLRKKAGKRSS